MPSTRAQAGNSACLPQAGVDPERRFTHRAILEAVKEARIDTGIRAYFLLSESDAKGRFKLAGNEPYILVQPSSQTQERPAKYFDIHAAERRNGDEET